MPETLNALEDALNLRQTLSRQIPNTEHDRNGLLNPKS